MAVASAEISIHPLMEFPRDRSLRDLPNLFDGQWVWERYCQEFGEQSLAPEGIKIQSFTHVRGRQAVVTYDVQWPDDVWLPGETFTIHLRRDSPLRLVRFPDDEHLPGLREASTPDSALRLVRRHVLSLSPRRMRVQVVRYRPGSHAVLRHHMERARLYVRVVRPSTVPEILNSGEVIGQSAFAVPRLAGLWREGGVLWFSEIPGRNLRRMLRRGEYFPPARVLEVLETLWDVPLERSAALPFNLPGAYRRAKRVIGHSIRENGHGRTAFNSATNVLDSFTETWRASGIAHNDFYDDQMVVLPGEKIALVDIEAAGPGDPMLDVGNFLAHLKWAVNISQRGDALSDYEKEFRAEALGRFQWPEEELRLREAVCLFRICTNAVRHPRDDWRERLAAGLSLVNEVLV